jgi:SWI/SNF-related matrix-associated actin-dependent regulator 1 of chromatin subfamily A
MSQTALFPAKCRNCGKMIDPGDQCEKGPGGKGLIHPRCAKVETGICRNQVLTAPEGKSYLPYQIEDIHQMMNMKAVLLASEMGVGKTIEAIGLINQQPASLTICIVCPKSLRLNWEQELSQWLAVKRSVILFPDHGTQNLGCAITIVPFTQIEELPNTYIPDWLFVDEAHYVKNPEALRTIALKQLARKAKKKVFITGTPIENRAREVWTLLQMLDPETWDPPGYIAGQPVGLGEGAGWIRFAKRYCGGRLVKHGRRGKHFEFDGSQNLAELNIKLKEKVMLRRLKRDVLKDLPEKRRQIVLLPRDNMAEVNALETEHDAFFQTGLDYETDLAMLNKASIDFEKLAEARKAVGLMKVPYITELIENTLASEECVVVLTQHKQVAYELSDRFFHLQPAVMTGDSSEVMRDQAVQRFQNGDTKLFIGTLGSAGVGITLTRACIGIMAEFQWKDMGQPEDRLHRYGQKNAVLWLYPVFDWSVDANMLKLVWKKMGIIEKALNQ